LTFVVPRNHNEEEFEGEELFFFAVPDFYVY